MYVRNVTWKLSRELNNYAIYAYIMFEFEGDTMHAGESNGLYPSAGT